MPNKNKKNSQISEGELQQNSIKAGLNNLIYSNSGLRNYSTLIMNSLDYNKINAFVNEAEKKLKEAGTPYEEKNKLIYNGLANYVASGRALKNTTIQTLFDKSHEGKLDRSVLEKIVNFFKPSKFEGVKYFEKARNAYGDMYDILSQDEIAQKEIPALTKAAKAMRMYGFLDVTLKNFKTHGMMDDKLYKMLYQTLYKKTALKAEKGKRGLEEYILKEEEEEKEKKEEVAKKVAASIIGFAGIMLMLLNLKITGAVIGGDSQITSGIVGVFMIFFALLLFFRPLKRSFKN